VKGVIAGELKKLFSEKTMVFAILAVMMLNFAILYVSNSIQNNFPSQAVMNKKVVSQYSGEELIQKEKQAATYMWLETGDGSFLASKGVLPHDFTEDQIKQYTASYKNYVPVYSEDIREEIWYLSLLCADMISTDDYEAYLNKVESNAQASLELNLLMDSDSYAVKSLMQTIQAYKNMHGIKLTYGISKGVNTVVSSLFSDFLVIALSVFAAITIVLKEKETNMLPLLYSTKKGRASTGWAKIFTSLISSTLVCVAVYISTMVFAWLFYGFGDLNRPIQSVVGFVASTWQVSVGEFLLLFLLTRIALTAVITLTAMVFCAVLESKTVVFFLTICFIGIETALYSLIQGNGAFRFFKYFNIMCFFNGKELFGSSITLDFFSEPISLSWCFALFVLMLLSIMTILFVAIFCHVRGRGIPKIKLKLHRFGIGGEYTLLWRHEIYNLFILQRGILPVAAIFIILPLMITPCMQKLTASEGAYLSYVKEFKQMSTEAALNYAEKEQLRLFADLSATTEGITDSTEIAKINAQKAQAQNLLLPLMEATESLNLAQGGEPIIKLSYDRLFNRNIQTEITLLMMIVSISLICMNALSYEHETGMTGVMACTLQYKKSRKYIFAMAVMISLLISVLFCVVQMMSIIKVISFDGLTEPVSSIGYFGALPAQTPIWFALFLLYMLKLIGGLTAAVGVIFISGKTKHSVKTFCIAFLLLILPILLKIMNVPNSEWFILNPLLLGTPIFA